MLIACLYALSSLLIICSTVIPIVWDICFKPKLRMWEVITGFVNSGNMEKNGNRKENLCD
jgi:hypothetical protein